MFSLVKNRTPAAWNTMISMYIEYNQIEEALMLYREMQLSRGTMNDVTCIYILQVCTKIGSLELVKEIHFNVVSANYDSLLAVVATLIHAYGSCGSMEDANMLFNDIPEGQCDVVTWNSYIALHAGEGNCEKANELFEKMKDANVKPNESTFNSLLLACCRTGFVAEGVKYFQSMVEDHAISPNIQHYGILLDLLGRAGDFVGVKKTLESMPMEAPITIWLSLLSACRMHGNVEVAKEAFSHAVRNWPGEESIYILMSNIYSEAGMEQLAAVLKTDSLGNFRKYATPGVK
jgi:pentatricopeptide repeat protein